MPGASYPKPAEERRNKTQSDLSWTELPAAGRQGDPPPLPTPLLGKWSADALALWEWAWSTPQATQWDQSGKTLWRWVQLADTPPSPQTSAEMRQLEDRHGLNPKAMLQLRWRVVDGDAGTAQPTKPKTTRRRDPRLKALPGGKQGA